MKKSFISNYIDNHIHLLRISYQNFSFKHSLVPLSKAMFAKHSMMSSFLQPVCDTGRMELPRPLQCHHYNTARIQGILREEVFFCLKLFLRPPTLAFSAGPSIDL